ncbi:ABC transporter permease [Lactobacillus sp. DCY120]|uniref:ABC transporter permease n=1 Tax=Bombilactobacillus apium TaxID=2675299 RepID=A0A850RC72_9LACO|nr:FtsX-like permease family protein [Bombilactobacillus apium]NVY96388.1 ABC transporter permease [Bombilactobacillus apium]
MKISDILNSAVGNLWHNKGRTILTVIAVVIGALTLGFTLGIRNGVNDYVNKQVGNIGNKDQLMIYMKYDQAAASGSKPQKYDPEKNTAQDNTLKAKDVAVIKKQKELKNIQPLKDAGVDYIQGKNHSKYVFNATPPLGIEYDLKVGRQVATKGTAKEVLISEGYVKALGYKNSKQALGKTVSLTATGKATQKHVTFKAKIVGVRNPSLIGGSQSVFSQGLTDVIVKVNQEGLPEKLQESYMDVTAEVKNPTDARINRVKANLAKKGYTAETFQDSVNQLRQVVNSVTGVLMVFGAIALIAASFGIINTLFMSVRDRTREIGLMKALGLSRTKVFLIFSFESILIGFIGSVVGLLAAIGLGKIANPMAAKTFLKGLDGFTLVQFNWSSLILITVIICLIAFLAGTLPARRAAKLDPITALRYE